MATKSAKCKVHGFEKQVIPIIGITPSQPFCPLCEILKIKYFGNFTALIELKKEGLIE